MDRQRHVHRPLGFGLLGVLLLAGAGYIVYDIIARPAPSAPTAYQYTIKQSARPSVRYVDNSFYEAGPDVSNDAYITDLTEKIVTEFRYDYSASQATELQYRYEVTAEVKSTYALNGDSEQESNVWRKQFQLVKPVDKTVSDRSFALSVAADIPLAEYKKLLDQYKTTLSLPVGGDAIATFTLRVQGQVDGTPFEDTKTATVTVPLDQQIYKPVAKYEKEAKNEVLPMQAQAQKTSYEQYRLAGAVVLVMAGLSALVFGFRKQIFKTPYQRELERIYRYHDGIIVRASRQPDLSHKSLVQVRSFDDMLNLEEEMKAPIVAVSTGGETTKFMIIRDDVVYVYILGRILPGDLKTLEEIQAQLPPKIAAAKRPSPKRKIQG